MAKVTIQAGDCLTSLALAAGLDPQTLWDHPDNAELKQLRHTPHALLPGDKLELPDLEEREESVATNSVGRFRLTVGPVKLRLKLMRFGEARADEPFELIIEGGPTIEGSTDGEGWIDEAIPADATRATLSLREGEEVHTLRLGHLDPHDTPSGIQHRLQALGFYFGALDADNGPQTQAALRRFQSKHDLEVTGEADEATTSALRDAYGS